MRHAFRSAGLPVRCRAGAEVVSYRMYPGGLAQLIEGWTKNVSTGSMRAAPWPVLSAVLWVCAAVVVSIGALQAVAGSSRSAWWVAAWALVSTTSWWALRRIGRFRWWTWAAFPVPLVFFVAVYARSLWVARSEGRGAVAGSLGPGSIGGNADMPFLHLSSGWIVVLNATAWIVVFVGTGSVAAHLSDQALARRRRLLRPRRFERDGRFYEQRLHVRRWKDRVPEAGTFSGGYSKRHLPPTAGRGIERFALETRRAELAHWYPLAAIPIFVIWNSPLGVALNAAFAVAFQRALHRHPALQPPPAERILLRRTGRPTHHTTAVEQRRHERGEGAQTP